MPPGQENKAAARSREEGPGARTRRAGGGAAPDGTEGTRRGRARAPPHPELGAGPGARFEAQMCSPGSDRSDNYLRGEGERLPRRLGWGRVLRSLLSYWARTCGPAGTRAAGRARGGGRGAGGGGQAAREGRGSTSSSKRRRSCSRTNRSILFTVEEEQKSGYLLEYLFGIVRRHTKGVSLCGGIPLFPERNNKLKLSLKSLLSIINFTPCLSRPRRVCLGGCARGEGRVCVCVCSECAAGGAEAARVRGVRGARCRQAPPGAGPGRCPRAGAAAGSRSECARRPGAEGGRGVARAPLGQQRAGSPGWVGGCAGRLAGSICHFLVSAFTPPSPRLLGLAAARRTETLRVALLGRGGRSGP